MSAVMGVFLALMLIIGMVAFSHHSTSSYTEKIQRERGRKQHLQMAFRDKKQSLADLKEMELSLARQVDDVADYSLGALAEGNDLITGISKPVRKNASMAQHTIVDVLLAEKLLSPENLMKAEKYKQQSKSPYSIDEILPLLGYVSPDVIQRIKRRYPNIS